MIKENEQEWERRKIHIPESKLKWTEGKWIKTNKTVTDELKKNE